MFCTVYYKKGLPKKDYESHTPRDRKTGRTMCPEILKYMCPKCGKHGHFADYCTEPVSATKKTKPKKKRVVSEDGWSCPIEPIQKPIQEPILYVPEYNDDDDDVEYDYMGLYTYDYCKKICWATAMGCN